MSYHLVTFCYGQKYNIILPHWETRTKQKCKNANIHILDKIICNVNRDEYGWWDINRLHYILNMMNTDLHPVIHCDIDIIIEFNRPIG